MEHTAANPPLARSGPVLAAETVAMVHRGAGIRLDYAPTSLTLVDRIIDGIRRNKPSAEAIATILLGFGAYTGEVLVRGAGATWVDFDGQQRATFGQPFGIRTPDGRLWNPLGKVVKRFDSGADDSLRLFYLSVVGRARL
jgi:hypothetical protein